MFSGGYLRGHGFDLEGGKVQEELGEQGVPDPGTRESRVNPDRVEDGGLVDLAEFPEVDPRHDESDDEPVLLRHERNPDPGFRQHLPEFGGVVGGAVPAGELPVDPGPTAARSPSFSERTGTRSRDNAS